ncbi:hypothetical protein KLEB273_gp292 [Bacillus phage vB_BauM_KLEB27-3]|nr:hypothetical protein KLEB273_gp292 [Bacillus phage vB_BauM_KLEB27-3]
MNKQVVKITKQHHIILYCHLIGGIGL